MLLLFFLIAVIIKISWIFFFLASDSPDHHTQIAEEKQEKIWHGANKHVQCMNKITC